MSELESFHDVRFPTAISFGATGGPERTTEIVRLTSGQESRNARFAGSRHRYDVGTGLRSLSHLYEIVAFFEARRGPLSAFRFRDPFDMKSCRADLAVSALDQTLGTGNGSLVRFALVKRYGDEAGGYERPIRMPVAGTLSVAVDGVLVDAGDVSFDAATGEIVLAPGAIPAAGTEITAGYEFDVPVRFDTSRIEIGIADFRAGRIPTIPLVEVQL